MISREAAQGRQTQGKDEQIPYQLDVSEWGSDPTNVSVLAYDVTNYDNEANYADWTDVTTTNLLGSATVAGNIITLPVLKLLTPGHVYRVETQFTASGTVFESYFYVVGTP